MSPTLVDTAALAVVLGLLGAAIGSFLNVVIYRVPAGRSVVRPASACPQCATPIRSRDNIPIVSWLVLRGRCRDCGTRISPRYPAIELSTAAVFVGIALWRSPMLLSSGGASFGAEMLVLVALLFFASITIALTAIDLDTHRLPNALVLPSYVVLLVLFGAAALLMGSVESIARAAAGAGILFVIYLVLALIAPQGMGMGDVKLAGVIGLVLGWFGWAALAVGAMAAFLLGGLFGIVLIALRRARRSTGIPFGPWMLAGAWLGIVAGEPIASAYWSIVGLN